MTYEEALAYIASLEPRGWRLGLDRMQELIRRAGLQDAIGSPRGPQFIHITGTNGKGSVAAYVQSILVESGYRTGAFFSPFVYDVRERIQFGRELISKSDMARLTELLYGPSESLSQTEFGGTTEFEFKAALGFQYWKERECEWVALEVGLGGRLDATNVATPRASVIVSIGLDHVSILGDTYEAIAEEKAGIIKPHVPVVVGAVPEAALNVIARRAEALDAPLWQYGREVVLEEHGATYSVFTPARTHSKLTAGIPGAMQPHNMALGVAAIDASDAFTSESSVAEGCAKATVPGRFERHSYEGRTLVLDGAHNAEAAQALFDTISAYFPGNRAVLVTGMVSGHEPSRFYKPLAPILSRVEVVPIDFHRALDPNTLAKAIEGVLPNVTAHRSLEDGLRDAAEGEEELILVTGSFYLVGEAGRLIRRRALA